ncbi:MAG: DUF6036 family nucleotidyltransferase [Ruminococcus sp.]
MDLYRDEIIKRLLQVDEDMALLDTTPDTYSCVIVGGSALVLMEKIYRSTHDIDSIDASDEIKPLLETYNINMNVNAYRINFPEDYLDRIIEVDIPTTKVKFYTVSLEDLVVSKLCGMRGKDVEDIENEMVYKELNWGLLDELIDEVCYGMLNDFDVNALKSNYENYKERFR